MRTPNDASVNDGAGTGLGRGEVGGLLTPQPAPTHTGGDVWASVIAYWRGVVTPELLADMATRREQGIAKYGTPLQIGNGRSTKADAYQEALDGIVYAEAEAQARFAVADLGGRDEWAGIAGSFVWLAERIRAASNG
jgi:hypothetical protein